MLGLGQTNAGILSLPWGDTYEGSLTNGGKHFCVGDPSESATQKFESQLCYLLSDLDRSSTFSEHPLLSTKIRTVIARE